MARNDKRFRQTYNAFIDAFATAEPGTVLATESVLAEQMDVSRTIIRSVLQRLNSCGIIEWDGRQKQVLRPPNESDRLPVREDEIDAPDDLEERFLEWVLRFDVPAGTALNVAQLSRDFNVSPHILQEFLAGLSHFGLVERRTKGGWRLLGFTSQFAVELSDLRQLLELNAISQVLLRPPDHEIWATIESLRQDHLQLKARINTEYHDFSKLDERFHLALCSVVRNRFFAQFQKVIALIFHYHYMWDKGDERERNAAAIDEHLEIIAALQTHDEVAALAAASAHLKTSLTTLLSSLRSHRLI